MAVPADLARNVTICASPVRNTTPDDEIWLRDVLDRCWGGTTMVVRGKPVDVTTLPVRVYGRREGFVFFRFDPEPELVLLHALRRRAGVASALQDVIALVRQRGGSSLIAMTTNDNVAALAFYRKSGFTVRHVSRGAVDRARLVKPSIPKTNAQGVPNFR